MQRIVIDPVTRIEGHLKIEVLLDGGVVKEAKSSGTLFRGLEIILRGRDPRDAIQITQRICGVCPICHATASALSLDSAFGIADEIPENGRIIRNLILGSNFLQSHILHFYHLAALDYVDVRRVEDIEGNDPLVDSLQCFLERGELAPFTPRYEGDYRLSPSVTKAVLSHYIQALDIRRKAHELGAIFGGKMPHNVGIVAGGVTEVPTADKVASFLWRLNEIREFIEYIYIPDVLAVAGEYPEYWEVGKGCGKYLSYGGFDLESREKDLLRRKRLLISGITDTSFKREEVDASKIAEEVASSWYDDSTSGRHPSEGETFPRAKKEKGYSWIKSPRYQGEVCEVGPLARMLVNYAGGNPRVKDKVNAFLKEVGVEVSKLPSVLGRHVARALECKIVAEAMVEWVGEIKIGQPVYQEYSLPQVAQGMGLTSAPRGGVGHWINIREGKIANYQVITPTAWNASPRDDKGQPGPLEEALLGVRVKDGENPFEIVRVVRSFDPCLACAVHLLTPRGRELGRFRVI